MAQLITSSRDGADRAPEEVALALTAMSPPSPELRASALRGAQFVTQQTTGAVPPLDFAPPDPGRETPEAEGEQQQTDLVGVAPYLARLEGNEWWVQLTEGQGRWKPFAEITYDIVTDRVLPYEEEPPWARYRLCIGSQLPGTVRVFLCKEFVEDHANVEAYRGMLKENGPGLVAHIPQDKRGVIIGWDDSLVAAQVFPPEAFEVYFEADPGQHPSPAALTSRDQEADLRTVH